MSFCEHGNHPYKCNNCGPIKKYQYCSCCNNAYSNHNESNCPNKRKAAIASATRPRACRALGCTTCSPGCTHYCEVCNDNDAQHRSINCPLKMPMHSKNNQINQTVIARSCVQSNGSITIGRTISSVTTNVIYSVHGSNSNPLQYINSEPVRMYNKKLYKGYINIK